MSKILAKLLVVFVVSMVSFGASAQNAETETVSEELQAILAGIDAASGSESLLVGVVAKAIANNPALSQKIIAYVVKVKPSAVAKVVAAVEKSSPKSAAKVAQAALKALSEADQGNKAVKQAIKAVNKAVQTAAGNESNAGNEGSNNNNNNNGNGSPLENENNVSPN